MQHNMLTLTALPACMSMQVPLVSVDVYKMVAIRTLAGKPEETAPLRPGESGFVWCTFADGSTHTTDTPNLMFHLATQAASKPKAKAKGKATPKGKGRGKPKAKAKGKAPEAADSSDESGEGAGEEENCEFDEEVEPEEGLVEGQGAEDPAAATGVGDAVEPAAKKTRVQENFLYMQFTHAFTHEAQLQ